MVCAETSHWSPKLFLTQVDRISWILADQVFASTEYWLTRYLHHFNSRCLCNRLQGPYQKMDDVNCCQSQLLFITNWCRSQFRMIGYCVADYSAINCIIALTDYKITDVFQAKLTFGWSLSVSLPYGIWISHFPLTSFLMSWKYYIWAISHI